MRRRHGSKPYRVIVGKLRARSVLRDPLIEQTYRYPTDTWTADEAMAHCREHEGQLFEPAARRAPGAARLARRLPCVPADGSQACADFASTLICRVSGFASFGSVIVSMPLSQVALIAALAVSTSAGSPTTRKIRLEPRSE